MKNKVNMLVYFILETKTGIFLIRSCKMDIMVYSFDCDVYAVNESINEYNNSVKSKRLKLSRF
jgi:hypothetical protein